MAKIVLEEITKRFGSDVYAVDCVSLEIEDGEFMVLVGPSGCGKTTILRIVAGLEEVTAGEVYIGGQQVTDLPPKDRDVAMVFQNYALYPHMSVEQNLGFGLRLRGVPKAEIKRKVVETATTLAIEPLLARKPAALSGGQRQRVAMGRAMVRQPQVFLMDEPLSNLDAKLRVQMRAELARLRDRLRTTTIYVTHDQVEAMTLGDRVAVLNDGRLQQVATPTELFNRPANLFVAAFIGSPSMNLVEARVSSGSVCFGPYSLPLPPDIDLQSHTGGTVALGIRPSDFEDAEVWKSDLPTIEARVEVTEELGSEVHLLFTVDAPPVITEDTRAAATAEEGEDILPLTAAQGKTPFTARVDAQTAARPGGLVRLSVDPRRLHFFNRDSGLAIDTPRTAPPPGHNRLRCPRRGVEDWRPAVRCPAGPVCRRHAVAVEVLGTARAITDAGSQVRALEPRSPIRALDECLWRLGGGDGKAAQVRDPWRIVDRLGLDHDWTLTAPVSRDRTPKDLDADQPARRGRRE